VNLKTRLKKEKQTSLPPNIFYIIYLGAHMKKNTNKAAILIVIDAVGIKTLEYLLKNSGRKINLPFLSSLGLKNLINSDLQSKIIGKLNISGNFKSFKINQLSSTADSLIGHREMMGIVDRNVYNLFPNGFPKDYLEKLEKEVGRKTFFNQMAGGIEAIEKNYERHEKTGDLIVYASKCDPLIQIAMNEEIIPPEEQKFIADTAFKIAMEMNIPITRAIARSYIRKGKEIIRTPNRYDAVLPLKEKTLVDIMNEKYIWTVAVGKTSDLVNTKYYEKIKITKEVFIDPSLKLRFVHPNKKDTNPFNIQGTINAIKSKKVIYRPNGTFIFTNLVDTDSLYGHTRDIEGALKSLEETDRSLKKIYDLLDENDILIITADHGMEHKIDYGYHSNEELFVLTVSKKYSISKLTSFEFKGLISIGKIISRYFEIEKDYDEIIKSQKL
jgi:phosphopentomutase